MDEVRLLLGERARERRNPFNFAAPEEVDQVLASLTSLDRDEWGTAFLAVGERHAARAQALEAAGDREGARAAYLTAYNFCHLGRYPAPNSPAKQRSYRRAQALFAHASPWLDPPVERVVIPFSGREGEGSEIVALLRIPRGAAQAWPVLVTWGGIDTFKEERAALAAPYLNAGLAVLAVDMPGVGDAPIPGSEDAERWLTAILDWIESRASTLNPERTGVLGMSTGGYWAAKVAHTHRDRLRVAIDHGGPAHHAFEEGWISTAQGGEYPFELAETLACAFGRTTYDEWVAYAPKLSLLDMGILDQPCAPLLLFNGVHDTIFPIQDMYLLLEHGNPKYARFTNAGHMGYTPETVPILIAFLRAHLCA